MATNTKTSQEFYEIYKNEVQAEAGDFTDFSEGSMHDIVAGSIGIGMNELSELTISEFKKTFFDTASGPEVTGDVDDLENLAVDHFGTNFQRPEATNASVDVTFSRPNTDEGNVTIPAGTVVKTTKDAEGIEYSFETLVEVIMTGLTINVTARAKETGPASNVAAGTITVIESALTDPSIVVTNPGAAAGGDDAESDAEYRETIRSLINSLAGATKAAIEGALKAVPEIEFVYLIEIEKVVIEYDIGAEDILAGATFFRIPYPIAYVADQNGASSQAIIDAGLAAIEPIKACGVKIDVLGAQAQTLNWSSSITLNPAGPNYATLVSNPQMIIDSMIDYINNKLVIGAGFSRGVANAYILSIWGPSGTNDLVNFSTSIPSGDVAGQVGIKLVAGSVGIV